MKSTIYGIALLVNIAVTSFLAYLVYFDTELLKVRRVEIPPTKNNGFIQGTTISQVDIFGDWSQSRLFHYSGEDASDKDGEFREELSIMAVKDVVGEDSDGSGVHFYGDRDSQHPGWIAFFSQGKPSVVIDQYGRLGVGTDRMLNDRENHLQGLVSIINPESMPAIYIEHANETEGDIAWKQGEKLQLGTWSGAGDNIDRNGEGNPKFSSVMTLHSNGDVQIGGDSGLKPAYLKLSYLDEQATSSDCKSDQDIGRLVFVQKRNALAVCSSNGWMYK